MEAASVKIDTTDGRLSALPRLVWPICVGVFFATTILKSGPAGETLPANLWNAVQFGPIILATIVTLVPRTRPSTRLPRRQLWVLLGLAIFASGALLSLITSSERTTTVAQLAILILIFLFLAVTFKYRWISERQINRDLLVVYVLIGINQLVGLVGALSSAPWAVGDFYRFTGTTTNANFAGILSAIGLSIGIHLFIHGDRRSRIALCVIGSFDIATLVWSGSRGAIVGVLVGVIVLLIVKRRWRTLLVSTIVFGVSGAALFALLPNLLARVNLNDLDSGRIELYATVLDHWLDEPILGIGYRTTQALQGTQGFEAHNIYLSVLTETGLVGFIAFLALLFAIFFAGRSSSLVVGAVAIAVNEFSESSLFGWGNPTALFSWIVLLCFAALGRFATSHTPMFERPSSKDARATD